MHEPVLDVKNLTVDFGGVRAVNNVSFSLQPGEFIGLIGPNGAGKTTVFNLITNSIRATSGEILFKGKSILGKSPDQICRLGISRTFQNIRLFPQMTAYENVELPLLLPCLGHDRYIMSATAIAPSSTQRTSRVFEILARRRDAEIQFHLKRSKGMRIFSPLASMA